MLRRLYVWIIRLHPWRFRNRFGQEMLSIFDDPAKDLAGSKLLADGVLSLLRQWTLRSDYRVSSAPEAVPWSTEGVPVFYILDNYKPRTSSVVSGGLLTILLFCAAWLVSEYTWTHPVFMPLVTVQFNSGSDLNALANSPPSPLPLSATGSASPEATPTHALRKQASRFTEPESAPARKTPMSTPAAQSGLSSLPTRAAQAEAAPGIIASKATAGAEIASAASAEPAATVAAPVVAPISAGTLQSYAGVYRTKPPQALVIKVTVENGQLAIEIPGESRTTLALLDGMKFKFVDAHSGWVQFVILSRGLANRMTIYRNGRRFTAYREK